MAADDIFSVQVHFELPTSAASYGLYYRETVEATGSDLDTEILGDAFDFAMTGVIKDMLSDDCHMTFISTELVDGTKKAPRHDVNQVFSLGEFSGPSLPNNCAINMALNQATFSARSDGRIRIPGIPEPGTSGNTLSSNYLTTVGQAFVSALAQPIAELSAGPGRWSLGIISAKVRDLALPAKDWDGAFAPVTSLSMNPIIGILTSRKTRAEGQGGTTP